MNVVLIRHTRIVAPPGVCFGRSDVPLAATFPDEAEDVRARLPWVPAEVWSSPAPRCRALADRLGAARVRLDPRLQELNFGAWEGRRWDDFRSPESEAWALDPWNQRPPGGESAAELWARVDALRADLLTRGGDRIAIVTHAGVIRAWRGLTAGKSLREVWSEPVEFGGILGGIHAA
ncbi:MAG: alpha-ribazole phosphatase family protein [Verrucomicrobia bacterium]|nr:alpha-ribazole phosphatase family protein [Verrucomicrobiota bacterium]